VYLSDDLEIWNLTPGVDVFTGPQKVFNVVGCLKSPHKVERLLYSLNGGPERLLFFKPSTNACERLENIGDFNIDTIHVDELKRNNLLTLRLLRPNYEEKRHQIEFPSFEYEESLPRFELNLDGIEYAQQVGQIVDGKWRVGRDEFGEPCLKIQRQDAGYDRIILLGRYDWITSYEITGRFCVKAWTGIRDHGLGIAFKWNPHLQGDGTHLPSQWSTGFGMYYIQKKTVLPGLRISIGVDVHFDAQGKYRGEDVLGQGMLSSWRWRFGRIYNRIFPMKYPFPQIAPGKQYHFRMVVSPKKYSLTIWKVGTREPSPQVVVANPVEKLPQGSVGIIAHHCVLSVYEFNVSPL
jgi:hypothetical protein